MTQTNNISISKKAADKINNIIISEKKDLMLKISVLGGGCAGFSYKFDPKTAHHSHDPWVKYHLVPWLR